MNQKTAKFSCGKGAAMVHLLIHHNRSAHTGAVGQTEKIPLSPSCAEDSFTQCGCIYIIFYGYRHMKTLSQHAADLHSRITGNVFIGIAYHPLGESTVRRC